MTRTTLPHFSLDDYAALLDDLASAGYAFAPVEGMPEMPQEPTVFLRHDIDLHITEIERMAELETDRGVSATYFVPLTLHFNPFYPENRAILRSLVGAGHHIGLHYDPQTYPTEVEAAWEHLDHEVIRLSELVESPVRSICMHFPWGGRPDFFRESDRYVHPHAPRYAERVLYISDSCRAWRDESLLRCFGANPPSHVLLNTHPELWLGGAHESRDEFLNGPLLANTVSQHSRYLTDYMAPAWDVHPAPRAHDLREAGALRRPAE